MQNLPNVNRGFQMSRSLSKLLVLITVVTMDLLTGMEFDLFVPSFPELSRASEPLQFNANLG